MGFSDGVRMTTVQPHPHPNLPPEGEGGKLSRLQAAHGFVSPFEGLTQYPPALPGVI